MPEDDGEQRGVYLTLPPTQARTGNDASGLDYAQLDALARTDLLAIARHWFGAATLPDNADGKRFLHGLLVKGLAATQVPDVAPWACRRSVDHYVAKANAERRIPDADMLGNLIEFSFEDLKAMKRNRCSVRYVAPCDAQRSEVRSSGKLKTKGDRERKQRERKKEQSTMPTLTKRAKIIHEVMSETIWTSVPRS